jgi:hypothetical protein
VVRRVHHVWERSRIAQGDVAYVAEEVPSLATSIAMLAFTADGHTQVVMGARGNELEEILISRPHKIVAAADTVQRLLDVPGVPERSRMQRWLARAPFLPASLRRVRDGAGAPPAFAARARWLSTGASLAFAKRARARRFVTLEIDDSLV